jgi:hypothetical protein
MVPLPALLHKIHLHLIDERSVVSTIGVEALEGYGAAPEVKVKLLVL